MQVKSRLDLLRGVLQTSSVSHVVYVSHAAAAHCAIPTQPTTCAVPVAQQELMSRLLRSMAQPTAATPPAGGLETQQGPAEAHWLPACSGLQALHHQSPHLR